MSLKVLGIFLLVVNTWCEDRLIAAALEQIRSCKTKLLLVFRPAQSAYQNTPPLGAAG